MSSPLLQATAIRKSFAGVEALRGASFDLQPGEVHALVGENGAGKSTLIKIITGAETADSGTLEIAGRAVAHNQPRLARSLGVAAIYQQPWLFPDLSVAENIALALETGGAWRRVDWTARRARARELLDRAGAPIDPDTPAAALSMPEQQMVEIAKAIGADARILILDEPTASLTAPEAERLLGAMAAFRARGAGVVYISHRLEEVLAIAGRITVLRDGQTVGTRPAGQVAGEEIIRMMVGREIAAAPARRAPPAGEVALELRRLSSRASGLRDVSLQVRRGEIVGLAGLAGSGRTELAETIFGLRSADSGEILAGGEPVRIGSPADAIRHGIAYVPEDRRQHGIVMEMPIAANVSLASLRSVAPRGLVDAGAERDLAARYIGLLRIRAASAGVAAGTLSGGNQQKVALARWLATNPSILILDEPTQGVDVASKQEIHELIAELARRGAAAILLISSDLPEILHMSDRVAVMRAGSIRGTMPREEATAEGILALALEQG
jgi:rhamnose transport system ATP-binding protein